MVVSMAYVASCPLGRLYARGPSLRPGTRRWSATAPLPLLENPRRTTLLRCEVNSESAKPTVATPPLAEDYTSPTNSINYSNFSMSQSELFPSLPNKSINRRIALTSVVAAFGLFLSSRLELGVSLKDLSAISMTYEEAISNGKPTVLEFYADWCEVCRELAPDIAKVEQQYKDRVNFVMLNVDNTKWEQELDEFGVEGIPHFSFLDRNGNEEGNMVGRLPKQYLLENLEALANGASSVPHARVVGRYSSTEFRNVHEVTDPRSHG
ncbi:hypothetical protein HPP92_011896 [Vanilla planifolia]|uniref:Thioredoxin-like protein HCF164, chloroplastic n=1 Tax=Vanilla planifolia TaxID=51239 RepID=A0A835RCI4_VANPL|nr:hypothetical protein HPP92_011896 [Vanilla planifolia]